MKPRLSKFFWRAFASTHPLMLPSASPREALLACPLLSLVSAFLHCGLHSFLFMLPLNLPLSRQGMALAYLDSLPIMIWYFGLTALFLFLLAKATQVFLPTALSVATRPLFPSQQEQFIQVFLVKPAPLCMLFAGLGSTSKSAISLLFSSYLTLVLSLTPCPLLHLFFYIKLSDISGRNCLLSLLLFYRATMGSQTFVSPGKRRG